MRYCGRLAHRVIKGSAFVVDPRAKVIHSLNPAASRIWELAGQGLGPEEIARVLSSEFAVSAPDASMPWKRY